jgi:hypothetical protein
VGAQLRLGWEKEKTAFSAITHQLSEYGATHHDLATVEDFEVQPAESQLRVTLRVRCAVLCVAMPALYHACQCRAWITLWFGCCLHGRCVAHESSR